MQIVKHPDPCLSKACTSYTPDEILRTEAAPGMTFEELGTEMLKTCKAAKGIGLAAPRVGVMRRFIVVCVPGWQLVIVNPVITSRSPQNASTQEGCLSYPGRKAQIVRPKIIRWEGFDIAGERIHGRASGLLSACLQHEIDHLDGVCQVGPNVQQPKETAT